MLYPLNVMCYITHMIKSFSDKKAAAIFLGKAPKDFPADLLSTCRRKLKILDATTHLEHLKVPPGNHLEALKGTRLGQHSIRINSQWRLCFRWQDNDAFDVEIIDYH
jgi:toxin HigB-1